MAYAVTNYKTKKALKADFDAGVEIRVYQPGPFGPNVRDGQELIEGPHYPEPHRWYQLVWVENGRVVKLLKPGR